MSKNNILTPRKPRHQKTIPLPHLRKHLDNVWYRPKTPRKYKIKVYVYKCGHCFPVSPLLHNRTVKYIFVNSKCNKCV